jgi:hypothetical protein
VRETISSLLALHSPGGGFYPEIGVRNLLAKAKAEHLAMLRSNRLIDSPGFRVCSESDSAAQDDLFAAVSGNVGHTFQLDVR